MAVVADNTNIKELNEKNKSKENKAQKEYDDAEKNIDKAKVDAYESSVQRQQKQSGNIIFDRAGYNKTK